MPQPPKLEHRCNSWTVVSRKTGRPVLETWSPKVAAAVNTTYYEVLTTLQWLQRFSRQVKKERAQWEHMTPRQTGAKSP